ncbi:MAG TPA: patatin-like phospholipase family protein [Polyangiales bacterium]|nr:patatin-like phospholipase family protein [Polyangiales bacterium]
MGRRRIAIACQGGGSQCAFVAGALKTLISHEVHERFEIVGLSGTSGGALTAALAWNGLLKHEHEHGNGNGNGRAIEDRIVACWRDLAAQTPFEQLFDSSCVQLMRLIDSGAMPSIAMSPSSPIFQMFARLTAAAIGRPEFTDLRALLIKHLDFDAMSLMTLPESPVLLVAAADVLEGSFKIFSSMNGEIQVESLLASAAIPSLFPAVTVDGHSYWDGIFSSNPPVTAFLRREYMGDHAMPQEIWIVQVNPTKIESVPELACDVSSRQNQMAGNLSLHHELEMIDIVNLLIRDDALTERFRTQLHFDVTEPIVVRFIRMSEALLQGLDYPSKLSRQPGLISRLIADGEVQASRFLAELEEAVPLPYPAEATAQLELH